MTTAPQPEAPSAERAAFEAWVESSFGPLARDPKLEYVYTDVRAAWRAWQARAALAAPEVPAPVAWITPAAYGSNVTLYKPTKPEGWDDSDRGNEWYCRPLYDAPAVSPPPAAQEVPQEVLESFVSPDGCKCDNFVETRLMCGFRGNPPPCANRVARDALAEISDIERTALNRIRALASPAAPEGTQEGGAA